MIAVRPIMKAMPSTATIHHHAETRAARFSIASFGPWARQRNSAVASEASTSTHNTPPNRRVVSWIIVRFGISLLQRRSQRQQPFAAAFQKRTLGLVRLQLHGGTERYRAQQRDGNKLTFGKHAVEVVDPYRHKLDIW